MYFMACGGSKLLHSLFLHCLFFLFLVSKFYISSFFSSQYNSTNNLNSLTGTVQINIFIKVCTQIIMYNTLYNTKTNHNIYIVAEAFQQQALLVTLVRGC